MRTSHRRTVNLALATAVCLGAGPLSTAPAWAARATHAADQPSVVDAWTAQTVAGGYQLTWHQLRGAGLVTIYASTRPDDPRLTGTPVLETRSTSPVGSATISGLDASERWYFEIVPAGAGSGVETATRDISVPGAVNVRDIGGYPAAGGAQVRWGVVFRSAALSGVTPAGVAALSGLGLNQVLDFRSQAEIAAAGADVLPSGVADVHLPIDTGDGSLAGLTPAQFAALFGDGKAQADMDQTYTAFVTDATDRQQFGAALRAIATDQGSALLYHCSAGKDRTGWMTAVLLTALGVPQQDVYADYLQSDQELAAQNAATEAELDQAGYDASLVLPLLTVQSSDLDTAFAAVRQNYGSMDDYLVKGLGLDQATLLRLRERLLVPGQR